MIRRSLLIALVACIPAGVHAQAVDGKKVFSTTCAACHQANGEGLSGTYPPLAGSEWVKEDGRILRIVLHGLTGPVEVAGETFDAAMPGWGAILKDEEIAAVTTYVRSAWGNSAGPLTTAQVTAMRKANATRTTPWTAVELAKVLMVKK